MKKKTDWITRGVCLTRSASTEALKLSKGPMSDLFRLHKLGQPEPGTLPIKPDVLVIHQKKNYGICTNISLSVIPRLCQIWAVFRSDGGPVPKHNNKAAQCN